jgi:hypothetical protein
MTLKLLDTLVIVDDNVTAIMNAYMADPCCGFVGFGEGYWIDPAASVTEHPFASTVMRQPWADDERRRAAIMLAESERA